MMNDWNAYREALLDRVGVLAKQSPDVAAAKTGYLEPRIHELIAGTVAVTTRCDGVSRYIPGRQSNMAQP